MIVPLHGQQSEALPQKEKEKKKNKEEKEKEKERKKRKGPIASSTGRKFEGGEWVQETRKGSREPPL